MAQELPSRWFTFLQHLPEPLPAALDPADGTASRIAVQQQIRPKALLAQDRADGGWVDIPQPVLERYEEIGRPTPLVRARALEQHLQTPAKIYIKREDLLPTGSFKLNSSIAQVYYSQQEGGGSVVTETGAGQWGHAVAYACRCFGLSSVIFWAAVSERQKQGRSAVVRMLGADVHSSPSTETKVGRAIRAAGSHELGSLGTAIGEAISFATEHPDYHYLSGSNLPHVLLHQTIIGLETKQQLEALGEEPDALVACVGGGSNLVGFMSPFLPDKKRRGEALRLIAAEAATAPRLTKGEWRYDHSDPEGVTPLIKSYTLGRDYELPETHVGGLRQHNGSAVVGVLHRHGLLDARAYDERDIFAIGELFLRLEGVLAAPESCHALAAALDRAVVARRENRAETIVVCLSGNGSLDLDGYIAARAARTSHATQTEENDGATDAGTDAAGTDTLDRSDREMPVLRR
jgi:pyridoxal-phosphate dependent TrpB-like enzyme